MDLLRYAFEADWMRPLGKPFWLAETASTHSGGTASSGNKDFPNFPGALRAKMWLTYALGADAVSFWLWRAHWAGQELEHGSLVYPWGDECANTPEIRQVAGELAQHADWLRTTKPQAAKVALQYGMPMQRQFEVSSIAGGFNYDGAITAFHRLLAESGVVCDVIQSGATLENYQAVFSPYAPALDGDTLKCLKTFVEQGGTWVLGPLSVCRTVEATAHRDACYGADLEKWLGIHVRHRMAPGDDTKLVADGKVSGCRWWCYAYEPLANQPVLAKYAGGPLDGFAAVMECPVGKGRVILLGTQPDSAWLTKLIINFLPANGIEAAAGVVVVPRVDAAGKPAGAIAVNTRSTSAQFRLPGGEPQKLAGYGVTSIPTNK